MMKALQKEINNGNYELAEGGLYLPQSKVKIGGYFITDVNGEDKRIEKNLVVDEGLVYVLNTALTAVSQNASWFVSIYKNNYTPVPADTAALFPGVGVANEATTEYDEATRPSWTPDGSTLATATNSASPAAFTLNTTVSVYGAFLVSTSVKGGTTGTLCAASKFTAVRNLVAADVLNITYQLTIADA